MDPPTPNNSPTGSNRSIDFGKQIEATPGIFDKMFKTFKILQQAPSYQDALAAGTDLTVTENVRMGVLG